MIMWVHRDIDCVCLHDWQIYHEAKKFGKVYNINVVCAYGGGSLYEQSKACEEGAEIIVATPVGVSAAVAAVCLSVIE